ncbi:hypothetical protein [Streptomyces litchfieldiae]|uniref:ATP-binding protein n=1 Tax=Streptomyces litchfieldiae TaxID=3075543 RepID=A0ABU2MJ22_9ACTN|nr:hypothetical protein [Streptomyces sp. DSM 44938]MDT0341591.1 hypothetical protein [Streptomyces sp. DSM 44938]
MAGARQPVFERQTAIQGIRALIQPTYPLPPEHRRPVVFFEGGHGSGKTLLLDDLTARIEQHVPYGRVDFAEPRHEDIPHTLSDLAGQLTRYRPRYARLRFPRLLIGLLVQLPLNALAALMGFTFTSRSQRWFGHRDRGLTNKGVDTLVELNAWAQEARNDPAGPQGRAARDRVAGLLCEAFLADLRDCPRRVRGLQTPLLLLDNADQPAGRVFLRRLQEARPPLQPTDHAEPLTVVATGRGPIPEMSEGPVARLEEVVGSSDGPGDEYPAWLRYRLPDLTRADIQRLMDGASGRGRVDRRLVRLVHEFTAGHPEAVGVLAAVAARPPYPADGVGQLLAQPVPAADEPDTTAAGTAEEWLLSRLGAAEEPQLAALATCAAARSETSGLWLSHQSDLVDAVSGDRVRRAAPWAAESETGTAVLRRLLLRRLAARSPDHPADWMTVHRRLRGFCEERGDQAGELYHRLAMDDLADVALELARRLPATPGREWLDLLRATATAPIGPAERHLRDPYALFHECVNGMSVVSLDATATQVVHLVAALRIVQDPLCGVSREFLHAQIASTLSALAPKSPDGLVVLQRAVSEYQQQAQWWG